MHGPEILARSMSVATIADKKGNRWQYHSRSDRHSKIACWGILFDLMIACDSLRADVAAGRIVFGINHTMTDFEMKRRKDLDLVLSTPGSPIEKRSPRSLSSLATHYAIDLTADEKTVLEDLPPLTEGAVGMVRIALEAKACMTAHVKACPRLYDELNSSHLTIHGATDDAIAAGLAMVNIAEEFLSPGLNQFDLRANVPHVSRHRQPADTERVLAKLHEIPRRSKRGTEGYDALGILVVDCRNDGSPVKLITRPPAPQPLDAFHYEHMVRRICENYSVRFK